MEFKKNKMEEEYTIVSRSEFCVQSLNPAREFPRIIRVTLIVFVKLGPVAGVWVAECLALPDAERLELNISNRE